MKNIFQYILLLGAFTVGLLSHGGCAMDGPCPEVEHDINIFILDRDGGIVQDIIRKASQNFENDYSSIKGEVINRIVFAHSSYNKFVQSKYQSVSKNQDVDIDLNMNPIDFYVEAYGMSDISVIKNFIEDLYEVDALINDYRLAHSSLKSDIETVIPSTTGLTLYHYAAMAGDLDYFKSHSDNPDIYLRKNSYGASVFHYAVHSGNLDLVQFLAQFSQLRVAVDHEGKTAFHYAVQTPYLPIVQFLAQFDDLRNAICSEGCSAIHYVAALGEQFVLEWLGQTYPSMLRLKNHPGFSPLHVAAVNDRLDMAKWMISICPILRFETDKDDGTAFHVAAISQNFEFLKYLLDGCSESLQAAIMIKKTNMGKTILHVATESGGSPTIVDFLLNLVSPEIRRMQDIRGYSTLHGAVVGGSYEIIKLIDKSDSTLYKLRTKNSQATAYLLAVEKGQLETIQYFDEAHPKYWEMKDHRNLNALHYAVIFERMEVVNYLSKNKILCREKMSGCGNTPIHIAAEKGFLEIVKILFGACPDIIKNKRGETPLEVAQKNGQREIVNYFTSRNKVEAPKPVLSSPVRAPQKAKGEQKRALATAMPRVPQFPIEYSLPIPEELIEAKIPNTLTPAVIPPRKENPPPTEPKRKVLREETPKKTKWHDPKLKTEAEPVSASERPAIPPKTQEKPLAKKNGMTQTQIFFLMRMHYPEIWRASNVIGICKFSQVTFKNENTIRNTLTSMCHFGSIQGTDADGKLRYTCKGTTDAFIAHTTHGSGNYKRWYENPDVVVSFLEFISLADSLIDQYFSLIFKKAGES